MPPGFLDLTGRTALVTGAGQGVGESIARHLAGRGARVVVNDVRGARAIATAEALVAAGAEAVPIAADVTSYDDVRRMFAEAGPVDILVNNAGNAGAGNDFSSMASPFWESDPSTWQAFIEVNLMGVLNCTHAALPGMAERRHGRIVTVISDAGRVGEGRLAVYSAAKAGAAGFMRAIAKAGGRHLITANAIALGTVRSGTQGAEADPAADARQLAAYAIRRFGVPEDVAGLVLLLASDAGGWITGQTIPVNGGFSSAL